MNYQYNNKTNKVHIIRDSKGKYAGKGTKTNIPFWAKFVILVVIVVGVVGTASHNKQNVVLVDTLQLPIKIVDPEIQAIRDRADIKARQEALVKETYLLEKKAKIQNLYQTQLAQVESDLSALRKEKLSFR